MTHPVEGPTETDPRKLRFSALFCGCIALCFLAAGVWLTWSLGKQAYLLRYGVEAQATVTDMVFHPVREGKNRRIIAPVTLTYTFRAHGGEAYDTTLERDRSQISGIYRGATVQVLYAERWPELNLPRRLINNVIQAAPFVLSSFFAFGMGMFMALNFLAQARRGAGAGCRATGIAAGSR